MTKASVTFQVRKFKRGEEIFSATSKPVHIFLVQSGLVSVLLMKDGCSQLQLVGPMQVLREEALMSGPAAGTTAIALRDTVLLEIPVDTVRPLVDSMPAPVGPLIKGILERLKAAASEVRSLRLNRGAQPCPADLTAKVFGVIFYTARYVGRKEEETYVASWSDLKTYATEVFHEDSVRIEEAIQILCKLGYAEVRPEPAVEQWAEICFRNMVQLEAFFDFYQNYHFKGGYAALLKTNERATEVTQALVRLADNHKVDRSGMVTMPYKSTVDTLKEMLGKTFEADQIFRLEQKGLGVKRLSTEGGGVLTFYKPEFEQMLLNWKVLREVELWNEKGYVHVPDKSEKGDSAEQADPEGAKNDVATAALEHWKPLVASGGVATIRTEPQRPGENLCPVCMSAVLETQKYCSVCDSELRKAA